MDKPQYGPGYVYLMHAKGTDLYKIGLSGNPEKRAGKLDYESPFEIVLIHKLLVERMRSVEGYFHHLFREKRVKGEWFRLDKFEVDMFCSIKEHNEDMILMEVVIVNKYFDHKIEIRNQNKNGGLSK